MRVNNKHFNGNVISIFSPNKEFVLQFLEESVAFMSFF